LGLSWQIFDRMEKDFKSSLFLNGPELNSELFFLTRNRNGSERNSERFLTGNITFSPSVPCSAGGKILGKRQPYAEISKVAGTLKPAVTPRKTGIIRAQVSITATGALWKI
jgi:hypothetical protein